MTQPDPKPIRKSDLPTIPSPEWEFHTWFPHPDGGGDMVRGERQRGVLVRRRISYSDWEPVRPDQWADEPPTDARVSSAGVSPATGHRLSVQHADALWDAVAIPGPDTPTFTVQHQRVCRAVADILDEMTPAAVLPATDVGTEFVRQADHPDKAGLTAFEVDLARETGPKAAPKAAADQTALRERYAAVICEAGDTAYGNRPFYAAITDAVIALAAADRAAVRAETLREAADRYTKLADENEAYDREQGGLDEKARLQHETVRDVAAGLRRLAAEPAAAVLPAIVDRADALRAEAAPAPVDRAALSAKLWEIAEHHIVAEWICCEPLEPKHDLCAKGYAALGMAKTLLVDSPEAWNPEAPLLNAVIAELRRVAATTEAHPAGHTWAVETHDPLADEWAPGTRYLVREHAVDALAHSKRVRPAWKDGAAVDRRLVRATTTYTVEGPS